MARNILVTGAAGFIGANHHSKNIKHLVYSSSSSVYGGNKKIPFSTEDRADSLVSLYAATKKSNELLAHCYSKLYNIPATRLKIFYRLRIGGASRYGVFQIYR